MESLVSNFQGFIQSIVPTVVLLGLLIFVHESGHFLVAKFFKVRVETFSLGFGKKLLSFKRGDTVYALSVFPLGGYVKMFGDDPTAEVSADQRSVSFSHKPVGQRIAIVLAGPFMNFIFAIVLLTGVSLLGGPDYAPKLGDLETKSAAYAAGFRDGDLITSVAGEPVKTWDEAQKRIEENAEHTIAVVVERVGADHKVETLQVTPKLAPNKNIMSFKREVGDIDGLTIQARAPMVGIRDPKSVAAVAGLKTGDAIKSINGVAVGRWREFMADLGNQIATPGDQPITLDIERGVLDEKKADNPDKLKIALPRVADAKSADEILAKWGIEYPELYLARTEDGSPAQKGGLQKGDRLVEMDGHPVMTFDDIAATVKAAGDRSTKGAQPEPIKIVAERDGVALNLSIAPNLRERMSQQGKEERHFEIGIGPMIVDAQPLMVENRATSFPNAVVQGITQTIHMTGFVAMTFVRLVQREVSAKNIGGFLSIGQMAKKSWQFGATPFLSLMAFISVNLFVLNLLPVPVLDGGHLVFYSIEAIKGGPLSLRKMEIAQQVGLALLLALMVFALYNDVTRLFLPKS